MCGDDGHFPQTLKDRGGGDDEGDNSKRRQCLGRETVIFWEFWEVVTFKIFN